MFCSIVLVRQVFGVERKTSALTKLHYSWIQVLNVVKYSVKIELMREKICVSEYIRVKSEHGGDSVEYSVELQPSVWSIMCAFKCEV